MLFAARTIRLSEQQQKKTKKKRFEWLRSESSAYCNRRAKVAKVETGYRSRYVLVSRVYLLANTASKSTISSSYFPAIIDNKDELVQLVWKSADVAAKCFILFLYSRSNQIIGAPPVKEPPKFSGSFFLFSCSYWSRFLMLFPSSFSSFLFFCSFLGSRLTLDNVPNITSRKCMLVPIYRDQMIMRRTEKERKESACLPACLPERSDSNKMKTKRCWAPTGIR